MVNRFWMGPLRSPEDDPGGGGPATDPTPALTPAPVADGSQHVTRDELRTTVAEAIRKVNKAIKRNRRGDDSPAPTPAPTPTPAPPAPKSGAASLFAGRVPTRK